MEIPRPEASMVGENHLSRSGAVMALVRDCLGLLVLFNFIFREFQFFFLNFHDLYIVMMCFLTFNLI